MSKPLTFWALDHPHFVVHALKEKRNEFAQVEVGSLDCHSLLKNHFVFQILEENDFRKRILLHAPALPSSFKAVYKLRFIKCNNHLRPGTDFCRETGQALPPHPLPLCVPNQAEKEREWNNDAPTAQPPPWPLAQACFSGFSLPGLHAPLSYWEQALPSWGCNCLLFTNRQAAALLFPSDK